MPDITNLYRYRVLSGVLVLFAGELAAQPLSGSDRAVVPTKLQYTSAISGYQAYADQPVQSWREVNDHVGRIGGWRAYAKEIKTGEPAAPVADPHAGHHGGAKP